MAKQLYRNTKDEMLGGVCSGLAEYFDVDPNLARLLFVVFAAVTGIGVLVYIALWLIVPEKEELTEAAQASFGDRVRDGAEDIAERAREIGDSIREREPGKAPAATFFVSIVLIVAGVIFLLRNLGFPWMRWIAFETVWPIIIIVVGLVFLWRWVRRA